MRTAAAAVLTLISSLLRVTLLRSQSRLYQLQQPIATVAAAVGAIERHLRRQPIVTAAASRDYSCKLRLAASGDAAAAAVEIYRISLPAKSSISDCLLLGMLKGGLAANHVNRLRDNVPLGDGSFIE